MKVSIVIPTYNRAALITECVRALLNQTYQDLEIIVADDGSNDDTATRLRRTFNDHRLIYLPSSTNRGAFAARNMGLEQTTGELVIVWDSDDFFHPHALERIVAVFQEHPDYDIVSAVVDLKQGETIIPVTPLESRVITFADKLHSLLPRNTYIIAARASVQRTIRFCGPNLDYMFYTRLAYIGRWYHLNETLGTALLETEGSETASRQIPNRARSIERLPCLVRFLDEFATDLKKEAPETYAGCAYGAGLGFLLTYAPAHARQYFLLSVTTQKSGRYLFFWLFSFLPGASTLTNAIYAFERWRRNRK